MKTNKISTGQIAAAYAISRAVFEGALKRKSAAEQLRDEHGLNINTAMNFTMQYRMLRTGTLYTRAMSTAALDFFLSRIRSDHGDEALHLALTATRKHIDYLEPKAKSVMHRVRAVVAQHDKLLGAKQDAAEVEAQFAAAVSASVQDSASSRQARLASAPTMPTQVLVTAIIYKRNPDVVAEVLLRAAGSCDGCGRAAPFLRKSNGAPYLEVHHVTQLAHGGADTVDNAQALCPNCHRQRHYG